LAGLLVDARGERLTPSHAVKKGRRYRYYVSASLISEAGTDRAQGWRLAARVIEEAVIRILIDALSSPARLLDRFGVSGMPGDQTRKIHTHAARLIASLGGAPEQQSSVLRELVEKVVVDGQTITIKMRRGPLLGSFLSSASDAPSDGAAELTAAISVKRRGVETRLVLLDAQENHTARCDPALVKAIARGRAWFEELATGHAPSLQDLAKRQGISRRYFRRLVGLAFLSPPLVEAILQGRQPVELTATRLTELDLPLDWTEQHKLLAN
jgi:site-specific DNA recombinase